MSALTLNIFVDGYGWLLSRQDPVFDDLLPYRYRVRSVLGYTNTALPTILTGGHPEAHGAFGLLAEARKRSPFLRFPWLRLVPPFLGRIPSVRRRLDKILARRLGWSGYFSSGSVPYHRLHHYDYTEQRDIYEPSAFPAARSVVDDVVHHGVSYWMFDWRRPEATNLGELENQLMEGRIEWAFIGLQAYDGLVHRFGTSHPAPRRQLDTYRSAIEGLARIARSSYRSVRLNVFSDHGLVNVRFRVDLRRHLRTGGIKHRRDVFMILDATMARFRYLRPGAEAALRAALAGLPGTFVDATMQKALNLRFAASRYGDAFFVLREGGLISPNDACHGTPAALHGYLPESPSMDAVAFFSEPPSRAPDHLVDLRNLITCKGPAPLAAQDALNERVAS